MLICVWKDGTWAAATDIHCYTWKPNNYVAVEAPDYLRNAEDISEWIDETKPQD